MILKWEDYDNEVYRINSRGIKSLDKIETPSFLLERLSPTDNFDILNQYDIYDKELRDCIGYIIMILNEDHETIVDSFEIAEEERCKGYGTRVISELLSSLQIKEICGCIYCNGLAVDFWNKFGAEVPDFYSKDDSGYLIPFKIDKNLVSI